MPGKKRKKRSVSPKEKMSAKIVGDFLRLNVVCLGLLVFFYILLTLAARQYSEIYELVTTLMIDLFGNRMGSFLIQNSYLVLIGIYLAVFLLAAFAYSVSTLINFDKLWQSLSAVTSDETEIKKFSQNFSDVEIALKDIKHDVFRSQQLAAQSEARKNDLVMYLAHDLKTPLTSVIGYLTLLDESPEIPLAQRAKYTGIALEKAYRLEQLINEFFEITRFNINNITLERNRIDLRMLIGQITEEFYPMLKEKGLQVHIDIPERIIMFADADKIARVFDNLLKNAVNYCYENTSVIIGARIRKDRVVIKFRNLCDEIPQEKIDRLFDKFFRVDTARATATGGSGLGLAIAKQIVELHGGTIKAKSTTEHTDFTVILPYVDASLRDEDINIEFDDS